jgi:hypothetical protein
VNEKFRLAVLRILKKRMRERRAAGLGFKLFELISKMQSRKKAK